MINESFFLERATVTLFGGKLRPSVSVGLKTMLAYWNDKLAKRDDRWLAYAFATAHHETDRTFGPIREYGRGKGRPYGVPDPETGEVYYGRGLVQLTWKDNYAKMGKKIGIDLVTSPDLALDLVHAVPILFTGMIEGLFTGKRFADYFNPGTEDWVGARKIINGKDKAQLIADYGRQYYACISYTT